LAARIAKPCVPLPGPGLTLIPAGEKFEQMGARIAGFRGFGDQMLRIDMAERMARSAHEAIAKNEAFTHTSPQIVSLGLSEPSFLQLMRLAGFRPVTPPAPAAVEEAPAEAAETTTEGVDAVEAVEGTAEAQAAPAAGANWAFRGRQKPRGDRPQNGRPHQGQQARNQQPRDGKDGGKPSGGNRRADKDGRPPRSGSPRPASPGSTPAPANNAFAGLADLLGRNG
jgi:ATP-dependent RNA helicase SUPV3L1/SUV3